MAASAGMTRRNSMPRNAPVAKATSVKAGNTIPLVSNTASASRFICSVHRNGWKNQENSSTNTPASTTSVTPSSASLAIASRSRPTPCVQANRNVPVSSSLASSGAPAKAPISTGASWIKIEQVFASGQSPELKLLNALAQAAFAAPGSASSGPGPRSRGAPSDRR